MLDQEATFTKEARQHVVPQWCQDGVTQGGDATAWREQVAPEPVANEEELVERDPHDGRAGRPGQGRAPVYHAA